jgi:hypothetical protein
LPQVQTVDAQVSSRQDATLAKTNDPVTAANGPGESRAVDAATIAWMLAVMTTLVCSAAAALVWLVAHGRPGAEALVFFAHFLHFSATATAVVSLVLMAVVLKTRREPPPRSIVVGSSRISLLPIGAYFL